MLYRAITASCCEKNKKTPSGSDGLKKELGLNFISNFRSYRSVNAFRLPYENQLINFDWENILLCF